MTWKRLTVVEFSKEGWPLVIISLVLGVAWVTAETAFGIPRWWLYAALIILGLAALPGLVVFQAVLFALTPSKVRQRRLALFETDYGRTAGWYVEYQGRRVAALTNPRFEEMFWDSYQIELLTDNPEECQEILTSRDLWLRCVFVFRNRMFDEIAPDAFPAGDTFPEPGRVTMRALYLHSRRPRLWERMLLWFRRNSRRREASRRLNPK